MMHIQLENTETDEILVTYDAECPPNKGDRITIQPSNIGKFIVTDIAYWFTPLSFINKKPPFKDCSITCHVLLTKITEK